MILSGPDLRAVLDAGAVADENPVDTDLVSVTLHLGPEFVRYVLPAGPVRPPAEVPVEPVPLDGQGGFVLEPGAAVLAASHERVSMPLDCMGWVQTKGSVARGFLMAQCSDAQVDPGFQGTITLEIVNVGPLRLRLDPGLPIASLFFLQLSHAVPEGYKGRYQGAAGPTWMRPTTPSS